MLISTILLIANLVALIFAEPFMSFGWIIVAYIIETALYVLFYLIVIFAGIKLAKKVSKW